jgi:hypothetical protein
MSLAGRSAVVDRPARHATTRRQARQHPRPQPSGHPGTLPPSRTVEMHCGGHLPPRVRRPSASRFHLDGRGGMPTSSTLSPASNAREATVCRNECIDGNAPRGTSTGSPSASSSWRTGNVQLPSACVALVCAWRSARCALRWLSARPILVAKTKEPGSLSRAFCLNRSSTRARSRESGIVRADPSVFVGRRLPLRAGAARCWLPAPPRTQRTLPRCRLSAASQAPRVPALPVLLWRTLPLS